MNSMRFLKKNLELKPLIIAEVGQNHQGDLEIAKKYIKVFSDAGADFIKFQCRNNKTLFDTQSFNAIYDNKNSFGATYGEHRETLELNKKELAVLKKECRKHRVGFMCTPFDEKSLDLICDVGVDLIKIASFDLGNLSFIKKIAEKKKTVVMSLGGGNFKQISASIKILERKKIKSIILHCVSEYPCEFNRLDLGQIKKLAKKFPKSIIGSSDHFSGTLSGAVAYLQGARVFEKHVTLNRAWKGTDHNFALEPEGFKKFVRDIKRTPLMIKSKPKKEIGKEMVFKRLGKSIIAIKKIKAGSKISINNLSGKIFLKQYIPVRESINIIGKIANQTIEKGEPLTYKMIK